MFVIDLVMLEQYRVKSLKYEQYKESGIIKHNFSVLRSNKQFF